MPKTDWKAIDGTVTTVAEQQTRGGPIYEVAFNYKVGDHWYGGSYTTYEAYGEGDTIAVRYDPKDPDRNDLTTKETRGRRIAIAILVGAILLIAVVVFLSR